MSLVVFVLPGCDIGLGETRNDLNSREVIRSITHAGEADHRKESWRLAAQARFDGSALYNGMMDLALVEMLDGLAAKAVPAEEVRVAGGWLARRSAGLPEG